MANCLLGLGSNIGEREQLLRDAVRSVGEHPRIALLKTSQLHETQPIGGPAGQGAFLNAAAHIATDLPPQQLLLALQQIEQSLGRQRQQHWGPRTIDIDILLYDQLIIRTEQLTVPHPRMAVRRFVLLPACEVAADWIHGPTGLSVEELLARLDHTRCYVAICCADARLSQSLAETAQPLVKAAQPLTGATEPQSEATTGRGTCILLAGDARRTITATSAAPESIGELALELLSAQIATLDQRQRSLLPQQTILTDFWLPQWRALAAAWHPHSAGLRLQSACDRLLQNFLQPRFTLFLEGASKPEGARLPAEDGRPASSASLGATSIDNNSASWSARYARALEHQICQQGQGPVLTVADDDLEMALVELLAGIDAMR